MTFLQTLNPPQREAVSYKGKNLLILAGAGSGKTRVITCRIAYLIQELGVAPDRILAMTFTNKAADEMKERVGRLLGQSMEKLWISTFHAFGLRILRRHISSLGFPSGFSVIDRDDQLALVKKILSSHDLTRGQMDIQGIVNRISILKNARLYHDRKNEDDHPVPSLIHQIESIYRDELKISACLDFDDLLLFTIRLFREQAEIADRYRRKFLHLLIDEYQDTNYTQYLLLKSLESGRTSVTVVGDEDQSIYRWRGADINNILNFSKDFPDVLTINLEQNYRSTQQILDAATSLVSHNTRRLGKTLRSEKKGEDKITVFQTETDYLEALTVVRTIQQLQASENPEEAAILYRTNSQSRPFEDILMDFRLPYRVIGGFKFYDRKEVKDIIAYLKLLFNPDDSVSLRRIINVPSRHVGKRSLEKLESLARSRQSSLWKIISDEDEIPFIKGKTREGLRSLKEFLHALRQEADQEKPSWFVGEILQRTDYLGVVKHSDRDHGLIDRKENLNEFLSATLSFEEMNPGASLTAYLDRLALMTDIDKEAPAGGINLLTLHSAKGLEFPCVFIVGMEEGITPHQQSLSSLEELEEERRLVYVGMTRAQERLFLSAAKRRRFFGQYRDQRASRFFP